MNDFIPISKPYITKDEIFYVNEALNSGWVSSIGKYINLFEEEFANFCGTKYAVSTSNGTTALHLALLALDIKKGDEVIIPDLTFIATANAVRYTGANVKTVDIDRETLCIDPKKIEENINKRTKAIIPVHLYGHPANMLEILKLAKKYNLYVIEDAAEAHGAEIENKKVGSFGTASIFSFFGNKIMTTGEGGMITTNSEEIKDKAIYYRDHSMDKEKRYWHNNIGYNYRLTNIQAALGLAQIEKIDKLIDKKIQIYENYKEYLSIVENIKINTTANWAKNVYWMICVEINNINEKKREKIRKDLKEHNIDSRPYFYPVSDMPMYKKEDTPIAHEKSKKGINLPSFYELEKYQIKYICDTLLSSL